MKIKSFNIVGLWFALNLTVLIVVPIGAPALIFGITVLATFASAGIALKILSRGALLNFSFLVFHAVFLLFVTYIFLQYENVEPTRVFDFGYYKRDSLKIIIAVTSGVLLVQQVVWHFLLERKTSKRTAKVAYSYGIRALADARNPIGVVLACSGVLLGAFLWLVEPSILDFPYPIQGRYHSTGFYAKLLPALFVAFYLFTLYAARFLGHSVGGGVIAIARMLVIIIPLLMLFIQGARAYCTLLWLICASAEFALLIGRRKGSLMMSFIFLFVGFVAYTGWLNVRTTSVGSDVFETTLRAVGASFSEGRFGFSGTGSGVDLGNYNNLSTGLFHFLYVIGLEREGVSLHGSSFVNLIPQALPSALDGVLWDRPTNDNYRLTYEVRHGGGFLSIANAYWNGGWWVSLLYTATLCSVLCFFDRKFVQVRSGVFFKIALLAALPSLVKSYAYGIQGSVRLLEVLAIALAVSVIWQKMRSPKARIKFKRSVLESRKSA